MKKLKNTVLKIINLIFPKVCSLCMRDIREGYSVCPKCLKSLKKIEGLICVKCGLPLESGGEHCRSCKKNNDHYAFDKLISPFEYTGGVQKLLHKFKYGGKHFLSKDLAVQMYDFIKDNDLYKNADYCIAVPLHFHRRIKRGYNQAELLAKHLSRFSGVPVLKNVLKRTKRTKAQFLLTRKMRLENIKNSFALNRSKSLLIKNKTILLVDDIATTCATINECAKTLKTARPKKIIVVTVARDTN